MAEVMDAIERLRERAQNEATCIELSRQNKLLRAELAELKDAAKGLIAIHRRHKDLIVYSDQDYIEIWRERVDTLAALVGEE